MITIVAELDGAHEKEKQPIIICFDGSRSAIQPYTIGVQQEQWKHPRHHTATTPTAARARLEPQCDARRVDHDYRQYSFG